MTQTLTPTRIAALALAEYAKDEASGATFPYSPARATNAIAARKHCPPKSRIIGLVAEVYYRENGQRQPLTFGKRGATPAAIRSAVAKRRKAGGRMGRWEVIAYSLEAALGRAVSVSSVRALAEAGGVDLDSSYTGRGTRQGAKATRASETAEVDAAI